MNSAALTELLVWLNEQRHNVVRLKHAEQRASELDLCLDDPATMTAVESAGWRAVSPGILVHDNTRDL